MTLSKFLITNSNTAIPGSSRNTTAMDGGSAENAGAIFSRPPWKWEVRKMQGAIFSRPPWQRLFLQSCCISSIHGWWECGKCREQFSADRHGWWKCGKCRSNFQPTAMDGGSAENAGSNFQPTAMDGGSAENAGSNFQPTAMDGGSAENAGSNFQPTAMARLVPTILLHFLHPWQVRDIPYILTMRHSLPSMAPRHTVHPVHKKALQRGLSSLTFNIFIRN